jgi:PKD repeat protein
MRPLVLILCMASFACSEGEDSASSLVPGSGGKGAASGGAGASGGSSGSGTGGSIAGTGGSAGQVSSAGTGGTAGAGQGGSSGSGGSAGQVPVDTREPLPCFADEGVAAGDAIRLQLAPSRVSGVAPLSVFFETTGTTATATSKPFHELAYCWDFDDSNAGSFGPSGLSKNQARGPNVAHVFEQPGAYTVAVSARDAEGRVTTREVEITVEDPASIYAATATVCLSGDGNFEGCPSGAEQVTSSNMSDLGDFVVTGRRLLLRRGEEFTGSLAINVPGPGTVGAFGPESADRPRIMASSDTFSVSAPEFAFSDWRIMDLEILGQTEEASVVSVGGKANDLLLLRVLATNIGNGISAGDSVINYLNANGSPGQDVIDALALQDCEMRDVVGGEGHNIGYIASHRMMLMGNIFKNSTGGEHVLRMPWVDRGFVNSNYIGEAPIGRSLFKLHAPGFDATGVGQGKYTQEMVISDNIFDSIGGQEWSVGIGPQNPNSDERVRDLVIERNLFLPGPAAQVALILWARSVTIRDNLFNRGDQRDCVGGGTRGVEPNSDDITLVHNTCYSEHEQGAKMATFDGTATNLKAHNNLIAGPSNDDTGLGGTFVEDSGNLVVVEAGFADRALTAWEHFALTPGSPAIDTALPEFTSPWDFAGRPRPTATPDVGGLEYVQ